MAIDIDMDIDVDGGVAVQPPTTRTRSPPIDSDTDTPPRNPPQKRVHHSHHALGVSYKECMKNHAASIGGHALDGCCEFMPGPTFNPNDPTSLKCGACGCHRNFHRRDPDDPTPLNHHPTPARRAHSPPTASQLLLSLSQSPSGPSDEVDPRPVNLTGGVLVGYPENKGQNGNFTSSTVISSGNTTTSSSSKKRFRTKFTQEQKEKMYEFSERIGWKLKKGEEKLIEEFVNHIGVERSVFKVWMHNNKHTSSSSAPKCKLGPEQIHNKSNVKAQEEDEEDRAFVTTASSFVVAPQQQQQQLQQHNSCVSNGSGGSGKSNNNNNNGNVGNCGTRLFENHGHNRQFNFGNGGGQEATQAQ